ncbi:hypothetical protein LTR56_017269 [Elasticomyces elasticus]|nr:hypothetical protein LTR56_017269 [Elasticomyces elasticus]KAK3639431.1 hypothetical protein LTR22_017465 [Elasticomyces elasticus]KAK4924615.1 hypothetical protein LTR49_008298 [Elasticomyces elasticus]KAK5763036.1 hypothetical protein LTS12_006820 [Elasticomyces elasticus]
MACTTIISVAIRVCNGTVTGFLWFAPWMIFWLLCFLAIAAIAFASGTILKSIYQWTYPGTAPIHSELSCKTHGDDEEPPGEIVAAVLTPFLYMILVLAMASICEDDPATTTIAFGCMLAVLVAHGTIIMLFGAGCIIARATKYARLRTSAEVKVSENVEVRKKQPETKEKLSEWQPVEVMRSSAA